MVVTLSMIVKNEEETLPIALRSIAPFIERMVIVDTGSTDNTCDVIRSFGADLHHFDWVNDFSAARNFALSKVKTPWAFFLDADDFVINPHIIETVATEAHKRRLSGMFGKYHQDEFTSQQRMFLYKPKDYAWVGAVHESQNPKTANVQAGYCGIEVKHRKPVTRRLQAARDYLNILLEKDPRNYMHLAESYKVLHLEDDTYLPKAMDNYWLAAHWGQCQKCHQKDSFHLAECLHCGSKDYDLLVNDGTRYIAMCWTARFALDIAVIDADKEAIEYAMKIATLAAHEQPDRAEAWTLLGEMYFASCQGDKARAYYERALSCKPPEQTIGVIWDQYYSTIPHSRLKKIEKEIA